MPRLADRPSAFPVVAAERIMSLDVFRGLAVAAMIVLANPGSWEHIYPALVHKDWNGLTPTDTVFPWYVFIVGVSLLVSLAGRRAGTADDAKVFLHVLRRAAIVFALGLFLNAFPDSNYNPSTIRIPGVLQRIAICYVAASAIVMKTSIKVQIGVTGLLLVVYWMLLTFVPVPGIGAGVLTKEGNLAAYLDNLLLHGHLYYGTWDPEGILSTLPAIGTTMFGVLTGHWLRTTRERSAKARGMMLAGAALIAGGLILDHWVPINKNLWSSSYTLFTGGEALLLFTVCYWLVDVKGYRRWALPLLVFGRNAITVYVVASIAAPLLGRLSVTPSGGAPMPFWTYMYEHVFSAWVGLRKGSLLQAVTYMLVWLIPMTVLYRMRIFIKV